MRLNFSFALAYNVVAASAAFLRMINPLVAAALMPISSLTLLTTTQLGMTYFTQLSRSLSSLVTNSPSQVSKKTLARILPFLKLKQGTTTSLTGSSHQRDQIPSSVAPTQYKV